MIRTSRSLVAALVLVAACRGKEHGAPTPGNGTASSDKTASAGPRWSAVIDTGDSGAGFLSLASGGGHIYSISTRERGSAVTVNGVEALRATDKTNGAVVILDNGGKLAGASNIEGETADYPGLFADDRGALVAIEDAGEPNPGGSVASYDASGEPTKPIPISGTPTGMARTTSGTIWAVGRFWSDDKGAKKGDCDGDGFIARQTGPDKFEVLSCDPIWKGMNIIAAGDDVVVCGSSVRAVQTVLGTEVPARTFVARIGGDGKLKWVKAANELGNSSCEGLVVTSDGDIVLLGEGGEDFDLTEDAVKKGIKPKPDDTNVGDTLYIERFSPDGVRRWGHTFGSITTGFHVTLTADTKGNAIFAGSIGERINLGAGPVGPENAALAAAIDRDAKVIGMTVIEGGAGQVRAVTDGADGLVLGFASDEPVKVQGMTVNMQKGSTAVVRIPLPLPPPPK